MHEMGKPRGKETAGLSLIHRSRPSSLVRRRWRTKVRDFCRPTSLPVCVKSASSTAIMAPEPTPAHHAVAIPQPAYAAQPQFVPVAVPVASGPGGAIWVPPAPIPGYPMTSPAKPPQAGQVVVSYEVVQPEGGCCKCDTLITGGLVAMILLLLFIPPLAFIPCIMDDCHEARQRPVYGSPPPAGKKEK